MMVSLRGRAKLAHAGLFAIGTVHAVAVGVGIWGIKLVDRLREGGALSYAEADRWLTLENQIDVAYWVSTALAAVAFIVWFDRAYKNLPAFGPTLSSQGSGGAIACWFIPFVNLVRPYQIAKEIWIGSVRASDSHDATRGVGLITAWWLTWMFSGVVAKLALGGHTGEFSSLDEIQGYQYRATAINAGMLAAAVLASLVVKRITDRQEEAIAGARIVASRAD